MSRITTLILRIIPTLFMMVGIYELHAQDLEQLERAIEAHQLDQAEIVVQSIDTTSFSLSQKGTYHFLKGKLLFQRGTHGKAFNQFEKSKQIFTTTNSTRELALTIGQMIECINYLNTDSIDKNAMIDTFCQLAQKLDDYLIHIDCQYYLGESNLEINKISVAIDHFKEISGLALANNDSIKYVNNQFNIAMVMGYDPSNLKASTKIYNELIPFFRESGDTRREFLSAYNLSLQLDKQDRQKEAISVLRNADNIEIKIDYLANKQLLKEKLAALYEKEGNYAESLKFLKESNALKDSIKINEQVGAISEIKTKYETVEKDKRILEQDKEILIEQSEKRKNQNISFALGGGIIAISIFGFLLYKNTKRKQRIAEQEKEIEIQKKEKILKEQELNAIDAMIEGQEKERQRLASDLHDSVGATLSAAKLQFDHIAKNKTKLEQLDELFEKTGTLLDDAYKEVRSMAHLKNSGVIAKNGLLPAIEKLAKNASSTHGLMIEVQDFGLTEKLEGSLEISIFRIIQELVTNIIKHANATEASISITQHDDNLSIIVEDNGVGFNVRNIHKKEGMGLSSIETRVEHLEGTMEVDTTPQKGTNILIDIPL